MIELFVNLLIAHLFADWFLQSESMAVNKTKLFHPLGILHAAIHSFCYLPFVPLIPALIIAALHYVIDLRFLLQWWRKFFGQTVEGEYALHVAIWQDQTAHIIVLWYAAILLSPQTITLVIT